jgi:cysteinyl-tRNA synthetase
MVVLMERLIQRGHAYAVDGDVYFDVRSFPEYGALTGQKLDDLQPAADTESDDRKRDPRDFALWKAHKDGEPETASWPTPWGRGRPGWHLECSAMVGRYLGSDFDIHGGGLDLRFPHHENEQAQSRAAGDGFARYWLHNGWVTLGGEKMSKSLGNTALVDEVVTRVRPVELRYYLVAPHYRSAIEFTDAALTEAAVAYQRIESFVRRAAERVGPDAGNPVLCADFTNAMDDDLGTPAAVAAIHETVRQGNTALADDDDTAVAGALGSVRAMLGVLGLDPLDPQWATGGSDEQLTHVTDGLVSLALEQRQAARARKDFAAADAIRDQLTHLGVSVEDTPQGPRWELTR